MDISGHELSLMAWQSFSSKLKDRGLRSANAVCSTEAEGKVLFCLFFLPLSPLPLFLLCLTSFYFYIHTHCFHLPFSQILITHLPPVNPENSSATGKKKKKGSRKHCHYFHISLAAFPLNGVGPDGTFSSNLSWT